MRRTSIDDWTMPRALVLACVAALVACSSADTIDSHPCPPGGTTATYENFGAPTLDQWCQPCHAAGAPDRKGAPPGYTFGSRDEVLRWKDRIYARAADDNASMPPGPDGPAPADRRKLADWLACGAP